MHRRTKFGGNLAEGNREAALKRVLPRDRAAAIAMSQAEAKAYAEPYLAPDKPVWLVGLAFERDTRKFLEGVYERVGDNHA